MSVQISDPCMANPSVPFLHVVDVAISRCLRQIRVSTRLILAGGEKHTLQTTVFNIAKNEELGTLLATERLSMTRARL